MKSKSSFWLFAVLIGQLAPLVVGDECDALVKSFSLDWAVVEGKSSYCSHDCFCDGIVLKASNSRGTVFTDGQLGYVKFGRVTSLSKRIPCEWAFRQVMILSQRKLIPIETPPVTPEIDPFDYLSATTSERQYNRLASMDEQSIESEDDDDAEYNIREWIETRYTSVYSRLNELEAVMDTLVEDRILPRFPKLVYDEGVDGNLFRRIENLTDKLFPENVNMNSDIIHNSHELIRMSSSFRRFFWTGSLLMEYIVNNGLSFDQTLTYLVSFTPFLHSLSYFVFRSKFVLPRYFADYQSVIKSATKYDPLYLDEPLWFIQLAPEFLEPGPISSAIDVPDPADFSDMLQHWRSPQEEEDPTYIQLLEMFISRLSGNERVARDSSHAHQNGLAQIVFILRYFREYQYETHFEPIVQELNRICADYTDWIEGAAVSDSIFKPAVQKLTISGLLSLCRDHILTVSRLSNLHTIASLANSEVTIRLRDQSRQIWIDISSTVDSEPFVDQTLVRFAQLDKFILAGKITLSFVLAEDVTGGYPGGISEFYRNVLTHIFDPSNGYFERNEITLHPPPINRRGRRRVRHLRVDRIYKYKARVPPTDEEVGKFIGIGRLLAAIVRDGNPGSILNKYYRQCLVACRSVGASPPLPMTVFKGFFFGSDYIRRGFYDVFLSDGIERMFSDACEAANSLLFIGDTGFVFQTGNDELVTN